MRIIRTLSHRPAAWPAAAVLLLLVVAFAVAVSAAQAQEGRLSWSVQPASEQGPDGRANFTYELDPGESMVDYISVRNLSQQELTLRVYASDAFNTAAGGFDLLPASQQPVDVGAWVRFDQDAVTLPPNGEAVLPFTLTVPDNATPGDHPGGIVASMVQPGSDAGGNQVAVDYRVGSRVYLRVGGVLAPSLSVEDFSAGYGGTLNPFAGGGATVSYTVTNTGNVRLSAAQSLSIEAPLGLVSRRVPLDDLPELLPGQSYTVSARVEGLAPALRLKAELVLEPRGEGADGLSAIRQTASAWALPWAQLAVVVIAGAALAALTFQRRRAQRQREAALFPPDVVAAVMRHMNEDHAADSLVICKALGQQPDATSAVTTGLDRDGIDFLVVAGGSTKTVRLPWSHRLAERDQVRAEVVRMYRESCLALGLPAREEASVAGNHN